MNDVGVCTADELPRATILSRAAIGLASARLERRGRRGRRLLPAYYRMGGRRLGLL